MNSRPDLDRGAAIFDTCAACHQRSGAGVSDGTVPSIAGQHFRFVVKQLVDYRHDDRWDIRMEHFTDRHIVGDAQAIADVAAWISQLDTTNSPGVGTGELVEHGGKVYAARCRSCHGEAGEGDGRDGVPRLAGQHYEYLLRQFYDAVDGRRPNFSNAHVRLLARLERDDLVGLADFLSRSKSVSEARH